MNKAVCIVSKAPIRAEPSDKSEMVSEMLFGEQVSVLKSENNWTEIQCSWDGYQGWVDTKQLHRIEEDLGKKIELNDALTSFQTNKGLLNLSMGSELYLKEGQYQIGDYRIESPEIIQTNSSHAGRQQLISLSKQYLNVPYLWGGRSIFGIDCSGLTQVCFKLCGKSILRDASQQARLGSAISFIENAQPGDLAFFDNKKGQVTHVGIILEDQKIIHASGQVRIDRIDERGILNEQSGEYSHNLCLIKDFGLS